MCTEVTITIITQVTIPCCKAYFYHTIATIKNGEYIEYNRLDIWRNTSHWDPVQIIHFDKKYKTQASKQ